MQKLETFVKSNVWILDQAGGQNHGRLPETLLPVELFFFLAISDEYVEVIFLWAKAMKVLN